MLTEHIMSKLVPAIGDLVAYDGLKWNVEAIIPNGKYLEHIQGLRPETYVTEGQLLLVTNTDGDVNYIPATEARILQTNPTYVMERLLAYLDKKSAIDWDQLDADHMQNE